MPGCRLDRDERARIEAGIGAGEPVEESMRANTFRMLTVVFAANGALVAAVAAIH